MDSIHRDICWDRKAKIIPPVLSTSAAVSILILRLTPIFTSRSTIYELKETQRKVRYSAKIAPCMYVFV